MYLDQYLRKIIIPNLNLSDTKFSKDKKQKLTELQGKMNKSTIEILT